MERQRHLLTTHLDAIEQLTGLEPGQVHPQDPALLREPMQHGYWLTYDYGLTQSNTLGWTWVLETVRYPADPRRFQAWTSRRELSPELA